ncbi:MAG: DJ-1/PfpI family protein, partial [Candidatus Bathyarchaeia archaeon]
QILEQAGAIIVIASDQKDTAEGVLGMKVDVEVSLDQVKVDEYDAIIYVGGPGTPDHLWGNQYAIEIAREAYKRDKVIGAICLAPGVLAEAGILEGKRATVFSAAIEKLEQAGCTYVDQNVVKDGNIITANGPGAAEEFGEKIKEALST